MVFTSSGQVLFTIMRSLDHDSTTALGSFIKGWVTIFRLNSDFYRSISDKGPLFIPVYAGHFYCP